MTALEQAIIDSKIEGAENEIRSQHNDMESRRFFGPRHFMPHNSTKFIAMIQAIRTKMVSDDNVQV